MRYHFRWADFSHLLGLIIQYIGSECCVLSHVWLFCDPVECSPPGSFVLEILQQRTLEWVALSFSRESSWSRDWTYVSCIGTRILYLWATWEVLKYWQGSWVMSTLIANRSKSSVENDLPLSREVKHSYSLKQSGASAKEPACQCRRHKRHGFDPRLRKIPWRRGWNPLQYSCLENPMNRGA